MTHLDRRDVLLGGGAAAAMLFAELQGTTLAAEAGETIIPWADQPTSLPPPAQAVIKNLTPWEALDTWITPNDKFFGVTHYEWPSIDPGTWQLAILGRIETPKRFKLADLKALPRQNVTCTLECSGNDGLPFFKSAIGNAEWGGTSLANILKAAKVADSALEVVFFGADQGEEVLRKGTPSELTFTGHFARSMSVADAMNPANILCYEMNGQPLPAIHGAPVRLIAPGWFGIANVKWLHRIEVRDTRFLGRFMGRDYVTVREEQKDGEITVVETSVGRGLLKSAPARVTEKNGKYRIAGMAWGPDAIASVEVKIDDGPWTKATIAEQQGTPVAWTAWHLDWPATPGDHTITSRATDTVGHVQPAMDDPFIANKKTYWESNGQLTRHVHIG
jgi:DMSO/TMAO reductase YedYZ molybdopterin-dependent catalytic subunit